MEKRMFILTMAATVCLAIGYLAGRYAVPIEYRMLECEQEIAAKEAAQGFAPFPKVRLLAGVK